MPSPRSLSLLMVPLAFCLVLATPLPVTAAPAKKSPPAATVPPSPPAPKPSLLQKLNPFRKKDPPPPPAPAPAPAENSKKSAPAKTVPAMRPPAAPSKPAALPKPQAAVPPPAPAEPKKPGFFSRLKAKLDRDPDALPEAEKPERPSDWKDRWVITEDSTAFYEYGPSQASGPDLRLARGQVLKLGKASRGWAQVELEGGRSGYIGTDQMRQAMESDFAPPKIVVLPQLAAGSLPAAWSPGAAPPDQPDLPSMPGAENSQLLLPPLEFEGTELKKTSLILPGDPVLKPGDTLPNPVPEPVPSLNLEEAPKPAPAPAPAEPAPAPASEPTPATPPAESTPVTPPAEPTPPSPSPPDPTAVPVILKTAVEFEQKDAKDTKSVTCEVPAQI